MPRMASGWTECPASRSLAPALLERTTKEIGSDKSSSSNAHGSLFSASQRTLLRVILLDVGTSFLNVVLMQSGLFSKLWALFGYRLYYRTQCLGGYQNGTLILGATDMFSIKEVFPPAATPCAPCGIPCNFHLNPTSSNPEA